MATFRVDTYLLLLLILVGVSSAEAGTTRWYRGAPGLYVGKHAIVTTEDGNCQLGSFRYPAANPVQNPKKTRPWIPTKGKFSWPTETYAGMSIQTRVRNDKVSFWLDTFEQIYARILVPCGPPAWDANTWRLVLETMNQRQRRFFVAVVTQWAMDGGFNPRRNGGCAKSRRRCDNLALRLGRWSLTGRPEPLAGRQSRNFDVDYAGPAVRILYFDVASEDEPERSIGESVVYLKSLVDLSATNVQPDYDWATKHLKRQGLVVTRLHWICNDLLIPNYYDWPGIFGDEALDLILQVKEKQSPVLSTFFRWREPVAPEYRPFLKMRPRSSLRPTGRNSRRLKQDGLTKISGL